MEFSESKIPPQERIKNLKDELEKFGYKIGATPSVPEEQLVQELEAMVSAVGNVRQGSKKPEHAKVEQADKGFRALAEMSYQSILRGETPAIAPIFLQLDRSTFQGAEFSKLVVRLKETKSDSDPFAAFIDQRTGQALLFPNPYISYTESMAVVYKSMTEKNASAMKAKATGLDLSKANDSWIIN